jgi:methyl-accepting chemotaxis protein
MATIKSKIVINVVIILLTLIGIVSLNYYDLKVLQKMQDVGAKRSRDSLDVKEASMGGMALYQIIADAVINRDLKKTEKDWSEKKSEVLKNIDNVLKEADTPDEKKLSEEVKSAVQEIANFFEGKMLPALKTSDGITPEIRELNGKLSVQASKIEADMDKVTTLFEKEMKTYDEEFDSNIRRMITQSLVIGLIGVLLQAGLAGWLLTTIMRPVNALRSMLLDISQGEGDLTKRLDDTSKDELAEISRYFNLFIEKLRGIISQVAQTAVQVASASNQLHSTAEQIATGAEEVASQTGTVATASEEMSATSGDIAQNCLNAADNSNRASETARSGADVVRQTIVGMERIAARVKDAATTVESLGARSDQIGAIVGTIEDIADQTNLLALNAAIEAARAGDQGRGFAVVADEVRALAERTTRATREIGEMIKAIQNETKGAVAAMDEGVTEVEKGTESSMQSGEALEMILNQINDVTMQVNQIATAAEEQTATTSEITSNISQITEVVNATARGASETASASSDLSRQAEELQRLVGQFKL